MKMSRFQSFSLLLIISLVLIIPGYGQEGMWLPPKLSQQAQKMQERGLQIPVQKIYNTTGTGLNNAVCLFGGGCTAEFISPKGLLLTNHHCGYGYAQALSTPQRNFLTDGFWAMNEQQEIPCPGLTITITREMKNVTDEILKNISDTLPEAKRATIIADRIKFLEKGYESIEHLDATIKPFYNGNQYWVILSETYKDVRLVAFPPESIGSFGGDTDNWTWPRMSGDFSLFRVYAGQDNKPAPYSIMNKPYQPAEYLPIATSGYKEGDFTMVYGYPYRTEEYITSFQLNQIANVIYPIRIEARDKRLKVLDQAMSADPEIFLKYAKKQASISNGYKKWKGVLEGLAINHVIAKKQAYEEKFTYSASAPSAYPGDKLLLPRIKAAVDGSTNAVKATEYIRETVLSIEAIRESGILKKVLTAYRNDTSTAQLQSDLAALRSNWLTFFKDYAPVVDRKVFQALMPLYLEQHELVAPASLRKLFYNSGNNYEKWSSYVIGNSLVSDSARMIALLDKIDPRDTITIKQDPAFIIYNLVADFKKEKVQPELSDFENTIRPLNRIYMKRQMQYLNSGREFYPDANQTLRLAFGKIAPLGFNTGDGYQTTLDGLIPRHDSSITAFNLPKSLRTLYLTKNYGRWAVNGTVPVNFIATNHTSGGNSGSPVLNGKGQLIGINFDRVWQGTMSDFYFDPARCRNISVDIRYILFLIEKYGHAGWLLEEMKLVK